VIYTHPWNYAGKVCLVDQYLSMAINRK
jgi:hypothetical protein